MSSSCSRWLVEEWAGGVAVVAVVEGVEVRVVEMMVAVAAGGGGRAEAEMELAAEVGRGMSDWPMGGARGWSNQQYCIGIRQCNENVSGCP